MRKHLTLGLTPILLILASCGAGDVKPVGEGGDRPSNITLNSSSSSATESSAGYSSLQISSSSSSNKDSSSLSSASHSASSSSNTVSLPFSSSSSPSLQASSSLALSTSSVASSSSAVASSSFSSLSSVSSSTSESSSSEASSSSSAQSSSQVAVVHPSCESSNWVSGSTYQAGDTVVNRQASYSCLVAGWCANTADWAYEPGGGLYWGEAWEQVASCNGIDQPQQAQVPQAVSEVIAVASGNGDRVGISWTDRSNNEVGFIVRRQWVNASSWMELARLDANVVNFTDDAVQAGESYVYEIISFNDVGESVATSSNEVIVELELAIPESPTGVSSQQEQLSAVITWMSEAEHADAFAIYRSLDNANWTMLATVNADVKNYTDESVAADNTYAYRITAINTAGESAPSSISHISIIGTQEHPGAALYANNCATCHRQGGIAADLLTDAIKNKWAESNQLALLKKIQTMPVANCDADCLDSISDYLWLDQWQLGTEENTQPLNAGVRGLRLLTPTEYSNAIRDILGIQLKEDDLAKPRFDDEFKYPTQASKGVVLVDNAREYFEVSKTLVDQLDLSAWGCSGDVCNAAQLAEIAKRLFRRPLSTEELNRYQTYQNTNGAKNTVISLLNSPYFLYLVEVGQWDQSQEAYALNSYEIASLLAFRLWGTAPDANLLALADSNSLLDEQVFENNVDSMLADGRFVEQFYQFIRFYTHTYEQITEKPGLSETVISAMENEQFEAIQFLMSRENPLINELFNPGYTYVNSTLANHYELNTSASLTANTFVKVDVGSNRGGLLHQGLLQVHNSDFAATSLVKRGKMIRENMMCRMMGVPSGVDPETIDMPNHAISTRERWDVITGESASAGQCWSCHALMNEPGSALENFDQKGRFRISELAYNNAEVSLAIDATGVLRDNNGLTELTHYQNARELSEFLASSDVVRDCFVDSYFRFATGHHSDQSTERSLQSLKTLFSESGNIKQLIKEMLLADFGLYRRNKD